MTDRTEPDDELLVREAMEWLIALEERPDSAVLRAEFEAWKRASAAHGAAWAEATGVWALVGEASAAAEPLRAIAAPAPRKRGRVRSRRVVAALALAACLMLVLLPSLMLRVEADHRTGTGEARVVRLEDGSIVHLAAGSAVAVSYDASARSVRLLRGEAYFDVVRDERRPFLVESGVLDVTVLGTSFDLRAEGATASVAVRSGTVGVAYRSGRPPFEARLAAGDWVRVDSRTGEVRRGAMPPDQVALWRDGRMAVSNRPLSDVVEEIGRYHRGLILFTDAELAAQPVSGLYGLDRPIEALRAAVLPYGGVVREITPYLVVISAR